MGVSVVKEQFVHRKSTYLPHLEGAISGMTPIRTSSMGVFARLAMYAVVLVHRHAMNV